jgi:hypothetical protein
MKTAELTGAALDWAVANCEGLIKGLEHGYAPSSNWAQSGEIIARERISLLDQGGDCWLAICGWTEVFGDTQLEAAMRCYVASKLGDEVEVPEELIIYAQEITQ